MPDGNTAIGAGLTTAGWPLERARKGHLFRSLPRSVCWLIVKSNVGLRKIPLYRFISIGLPISLHLPAPEFRSAGQVASTAVRQPQGEFLAPLSGVGKFRIYKARWLGKGETLALAERHKRRPASRYFCDQRRNFSRCHGLLSGTARRLPDLRGSCLG